jgi:putative component of membrane protein insertase Oxa1/YidC/SpoIIIJ protein YidD
MLASVALSLIGGYQRWLSPRKGYACAYRLAHGGTGCSGFAKAAIAETGLFAALPAIRQRFRDCKTAALTMTTDTSANPKRRKDRWYHNCDCSGCDWPICRSRHGADVATDGCECAPDACSP